MHAAILDRYLFILLARRVVTCLHIPGTVPASAAYAVAGRLSKGDMKVQNKITKVLQHMAHTHEQMARILDAERHVAVRMSQIVHDLPDADPDFDGISGMIESSTQVNKNIIAYLNALADLEEAMAEGVGRVIKELNGQDEE
jgi:hypothetical protein